MLSFEHKVCKPPKDAEEVTNLSSKRFYRQVAGEEKRLHDYHQKEIQSTLENPRLRDDADITVISAELKEFKRQQFLEKKRRQKLHANNEELRILENNIRCAYVAKELAAQKTEHEQMRQAERQTKKTESEEFEALRLCTQEAFAEQHEKEQMKKKEIRSQLQSQMAEVRAARLREYEQVMRERDEMQKLLQRMRKEDENEREALAERRRVEKQEVADYLRDRELYMLKQKSEKVEEADKFLEMRRQRDEEERRKAEKKRQELEQRVAESDRMGQEIHAINMEKQMRASLLTDLLVEERMAMQEQQHRMQLQRQWKLRENTLMDLNAFLAKKMHEHTKPGQMSPEDKLFYDQEMRILAQRDKLEQLSEEKRRNFMEEHRKAMIKLIEVRKEERKERTAENLFVDAEERRHECNRLKEVEVERDLMLKSHAAEVLRYLPTNTLRAEERYLLQEPTNDLSK